jgi:pyruvate dehydrogenase E1 component alpha subunit
VALERARTGCGATFIEAVTYRMGPHTTSDDPSRYEDLAEREEWAAKDPITRFELYLDGLGLLTDEVRASVKAASDDAAKRFRAACIALPDPEPLSVFDHVYSEPNANLDRQKREFAAYLSYIEGGTR